jgi:hypothetical protein
MYTAVGWWPRVAQRFQSVVIIVNNKFYERLQVETSYKCFYQYVF